MSRRCSDSPKDLVFLHICSISLFLRLSVYFTRLHYHTLTTLSGSIYLFFIVLSHKTLVAMNVCSTIEAPLQNTFKSAEIRQKNPQWSMQFNNHIESSHWIFSHVEVSWTPKDFSNRELHDITIIVLFTDKRILMAVACKIEDNPGLEPFTRYSDEKNPTLHCVQVTCHDVYKAFNWESEDNVSVQNDRRPIWGCLISN